MYDRSFNVDFTRINFHFEETGLMQYTVYADSIAHPRSFDRIGYIRFAAGQLSYKVYGSRQWYLPEEQSIMSLAVDLHKCYHERKLETFRRSMCA